MSGVCIHFSHCALNVFRSSCLWSSAKYDNWLITCSEKLKWSVVILSGKFVFILRNWVGCVCVLGNKKWKSNSIF